jgi:dolichol-phosphate mannosyltransferase
MTREDAPPPIELSVIIPAMDEGPNLEELLPELHRVLGQAGIGAEILVVVVPSDRATGDAARRSDARVVEQSEPGYGGATLAGFAAARGAFLLTMDGDLSHPPSVVPALWRQRHDAGILIASRFVPGGRALRPTVRHRLSRPLNVLFRRALRLPLYDLTCGFRLYQADVVRGQRYVARDLDILQEILLRADADGWAIRETPFVVAPRKYGRSHTDFLRVGRAYVRTLPGIARWHRASMRRRSGLP